jgi:FkbM family methyltransferase
MKTKVKQLILLLVKKMIHIPRSRKLRHFFEHILFDVLEKMSGKQEFQSFFEKLYQKVLLGMFIGSGGNVEESGELWVLKYINEVVPPPVDGGSIVVFDVGANLGKYTNMIYEIMGEIAKIYSFEPSKATYQKLMQNTVELSNVNHYNFGFGREDTILTLYSDTEESGLASLLKRHLEHFDIKMDLEEKVEITTIDSFCFSNSITHIHLLKLDVEGNELNVLRGARRMIESNNVDFIQFEFGGCNIDSRTYFQDFYYLLKDRYAICRIVKDGFHSIKEYKEMYECFIATNFLAIRKNML